MSCSIVGHPCRWARRDPNDCIGNYYALQPGEAANGMGVDIDGKHYYCALLWRDEHDLTDENGPDGEPDGVRDTAVNRQEFPSGVRRFPSSGFCAQKGMCDKWQAAENDTGRDAPFRRK